MNKIVYGFFYKLPIHYVLMIMIFMLVSCRIINKKNQSYLKMVNGLATLIYSSIILIITLKSRDNTYEIVLTPFELLKEARKQPEIYRSMFMNVLLFFPLGLTLPFALPEKWNHKALLTITFALILSFTIELLQFHYHLGRAETDDVICNTLGAAIGTLSYQLSKYYT